MGDGAGPHGHGSALHRQHGVDRRPGQDQQEWSGLLMVELAAVWRRRLRYWVDYVNNLVPSPQSFLVPGFNIAGTSPSDLQSSLAPLEQQYPSLDGAFIWQSKTFATNGYKTSQYTQAIAAALSGQSVLA